MHEARRWVDRNIVIPQARADLLKHVRQAEADHRDFDCRIGPDIAGGRAVWAWSVAGAFFAFRLTGEQRRRLELKEATMTFRTRRRREEPQPTTLPVVIKHVAFEQDPLAVDQPIVLTLTSSTQPGYDLPWAATLELLRPGVGHEQHWAYPPPGARLNGPARLQFARLHDGSGPARHPSRACFRCSSPSGTCRTPRIRGAGFRSAHPLVGCWTWRRRHRTNQKPDADPATATLQRPA